jgi:hypothetical protein
MGKISKSFDLSHLCPKMRLAIFGLSLFLAAFSPAILPGQTVSPAVVEYQQEARSRFEITNETVFPLSVVLEPRMFTVTEKGDVVYSPIDTAQIHLKLSAMSFRIPPRQTYTVFYEAKSKSLPAWFMIAASLSGARTQTGLSVQIELPHVVYLLQKGSLQKSDVTLRSFKLDSTGKKVFIEVENTSDRLGRGLAAEAVLGRETRAAGSFPMFPHSKRLVEVPWDLSNAPERVLVRFTDFNLEQKQAAASP